MDLHAGYILILALIYAAGMAAFSLAFLVDWIRNFERIRGYWRLAVGAALILVGLNVMAIVGSPGDWTMMRTIGIASLPVLFVRIVGVVMLGTYYCARLRYPSFLLLPQGPLIEQGPPTDVPLPAPEDAGPHIGCIGPDIPPTVAEVLAEPTPQVDVPVPPADSPRPQVDSPATEAAESSPPVTWSLRTYIRDVLIVAAVAVVYSTVLFLLTKPQLTEAIQRAFESRHDAADDVIFTPFAILVVLLFALAEEIFFRLGIQNFLAHYLRWQGKRYWAAIALTSLLWTLGHAGVLDPNWVKLAQVYPVGLMLGWLFRKYGVEASMLAHGLFNVVMTGLSATLLT